MAQPITVRISEELGLPLSQVEATAKLLGDGVTMPFIARYRKEAAGDLDEVAITSIRDRATQLKGILAELAKPGRDPREKFEVGVHQDGLAHVSQLS